MDVTIHIFDMENYDYIFFKVLRDFTRVFKQPNTDLCPISMMITFGLTLILKLTFAWNCLNI